MASGTDQDDGYDIFPQSDQILAQSYIYVGWLRKRGTQSFLGAKPWADRLFTTPEGGKTIEYWSPSKGIRKGGGGLSSGMPPIGGRGFFLCKFFDLIF